MTKKKILVAFDWNGTLFDDARACWEAWNAAFALFGKSIPFEKFQASYDQPFDRFLLNLGFTDGFAKENIPMILEVVHRTYVPIEDQTPLREAAVDTLDLIKSHDASSIIISNHLVDRINIQCARTGIADKIDAVLANRDVKEQAERKPKIEWLLDYCKKSGHDTGNVIIVGDTPEEIRLAHEFGMVGVAITGGFVSEERLLAENPRFMISKLSQIRRVLDSALSRSRA